MSEFLRRKWSFKVNGQKQILIKRPEEKEEHVLMKIFLAQLYSQFFEDIKIEVRYAGELRYKPDLLALDLQGNPIFWGECGEVSQEKLTTLIRKYRSTHLCFSKWDIKTAPFEQMIEVAVRQLKKRRTAPVDFINFPDATRHCIADHGEIRIRWDKVELKRWA